MYARLHPIAALERSHYQKCCRTGTIEYWRYGCSYPTGIKTCKAAYAAGKPMHQGGQMAEQAKIEKFSKEELRTLHMELDKDSIDSWQAADIVSEFLTGRGYGVCAHQIRSAMLRVEGGTRNFLRMQEELEKVAFVM